MSKAKATDLDLRATITESASATLVRSTNTKNGKKLLIIWNPPEFYRLVFFINIPAKHSSLSTEKIHRSNQIN